MKLLLKSFFFWWLTMGTGCSFAGTAQMQGEAHTYHVEIPHFGVEYRMPPFLVPGYGGQQREVPFLNLEKDSAYYRLGDRAYQRDIATFFCGVVGDFRKWDMTVQVFVVKFDEGKKRIGSSTDLSEYVRTVFSEKVVLENGKEFGDFGGAVVEKIGLRDVVIASAADLYHINSIQLKSGARTTRRPYQIYFIPLDDLVVFGIRVFHDNEKLLTPQWHANAKAIAVSIIQDLKAALRE